MINREDIIRMAREVIEERGGSRVDDEDDLIAYSIQLAAFVTEASAAKEREACAKVCEETEVVCTTYCMTLHDEGAETLRNAAFAAIRERSANARARR